MSGVKCGVLCHSSSVLLCTSSALESKSRQQLDRCMAATVWAARHHSNMHHTLSLPAAWKPHQCTSIRRHRLKPTRRNMFIRNQRGTYVHELKWHLIEIWSATSRASLINRQISDEIVLLRVSKPKANTLNSFYDVFLYDDVIFMTFKANITAAVVNKLTYVSFHKVVWEQTSGEVVSFVAVLLQIY